MRIATVERHGIAQLALEHDGRYYPWGQVMSTPAPADLVDLLEALCAGALPAPDFTDATEFTGPLTLLPPFVPPRNVICVGKNYADHVNEFDTFSGQESAVPGEPIIFTKSPSAICGPYDEITVSPELATMLDYEVELAVVIGRIGHRISAADALSHVAAYAVINDVTDRASQARHAQWFLAKSLRCATPFGPVLVSADELAPDARLTTYVDGELRQDDRLPQLIFGLETIIEYVSSFIELRPGDVIATGTPSGVGIGSDPPRCIADGSTVVCAIEGIGALENRFRFSADAAPTPSSRVTATSAS